LSLIAGAPQSFIQNISQPLYARRPEVALPESAMLTPQAHEGTMQEEQVSVSNRPPRSVGVVGGVPGGVSGGQMHGVIGGALAAPNMVNEQMGMAAREDRFDQLAKLNSAAESKELGDYFEYNIKQSITIGKNQSALVPILQSRIDAEKVTLWTANGSQPPLRALWIKNASGLTLDAGTFNIIDNGTFAGEGLIETVHANERRLLSYAADTGIRITSQFESRDLPISRVQILKGVMFLTKEHRDKIKYAIRNADTSSRQVVIEHPVREGWKLVNTDKPQETSASHYRFQVAVDPDKTKELAVEEVHQDVSRSMLTDITQHQVEVLTTENVMTPELQVAFRRVLDQKTQISKLQSETGTRQMELNAINTDQARIRENMKALRGSVEEKALLARYTHQLNSQEDRLSLLHKEITDLDQRQNTERQKLDDMVQHITL
jgi:flagellin-like hook-associated protein FlgL